MYSFFHSERHLALLLPIQSGPRGATMQHQHRWSPAVAAKADIPSPVVVTQHLNAHVRRLVAELEEPLKSSFPD